MQGMRFRGFPPWKLFVHIEQFTVANGVRILRTNNSNPDWPEIS